MSKIDNTPLHCYVPAIPKLFGRPHFLNNETYERRYPASKLPHPVPYPKPRDLHTSVLLLTMVSSSGVSHSRRYKPHELTQYLKKYDEGLYGSCKPNEIYTGSVTHETALEPIDNHPMRFFLHSPELAWILLYNGNTHLPGYDNIWENYANNYSKNVKDAFSGLWQYLGFRHLIDILLLLTHKDAVSMLMNVHQLGKIKVHALIKCIHDLAASQGLDTDQFSSGVRKIATE